MKVMLLPPRRRVHAEKRREPLRNSAQPLRLSGDIFFSITFSSLPKNYSLKIKFSRKLDFSRGVTRHAIAESSKTWIWSDRAVWASRVFGKIEKVVRVRQIPRVNPQIEAHCFRELEFFGKRGIGLKLFWTDKKVSSRVADFSRGGNRKHIALFEIKEKIRQ